MSENATPKILKERKYEDIVQRLYMWGLLKTEETEGHPVILLKPEEVSKTEELYGAKLRIIDATVRAAERCTSVFEKYISVDISQKRFIDTLLVMQRENKDREIAKEVSRLEKHIEKYLPIWGEPVLGLLAIEAYNRIRLPKQ